MKKKYYNFVYNKLYRELLLKAHNFLILIYNNLNEDSTLYRIFNQYNSHIKYNHSVGHHSFIGSLLTLNDIKLDLYNLSLPYYFIYDNKDKIWSYYEPVSKNVFINSHLFQKSFFNLKDDDLERVSYLILLILINQRGAHSKIDDINENIFPRYYYLPNFKFVIMKKKESGNFIEQHFYSDNLIELLNDNENFPLLLKDVNLFIQPTFIQLKELIDKNISNISHNYSKETEYSLKPTLRKRKKILTRGYLFSKFNLIILDTTDEDFTKIYNDPEYKEYLKLKRILNTKNIN